jgi:hypothetical protein
MRWHLVLGGSWPSLGGALCFEPPANQAGKGAWFRIQGASRKLELFIHSSIIPNPRADAEFVDELFARLKDPGSDSGAQTQLLGFLTEFLTLGKELPAEARAQMLKVGLGLGGG